MVWFFKKHCRTDANTAVFKAPWLHCHDAIPIGPWPARYAHASNQQTGVKGERCARRGNPSPKASVDTARNVQHFAAIHLFHFTVF
jgi:hypothetical protein